MAGVAAQFLADNPQATPAEVKAAIVHVCLYLVHDASCRRRRPLRNGSFKLSSCDHSNQACHNRSQGGACTHLQATLITV